MYVTVQKPIMSCFVDNLLLWQEGSRWPESMIVPSRQLSLNHRLCSYGRPFSDNISPPPSPDKDYLTYLFVFSWTPTGDNGLDVIMIVTVIPNSQYGPEEFIK